MFPQISHHNQHTMRRGGKAGSVPDSLSFPLDIRHMLKVAGWFEHAGGMWCHADVEDYGHHTWTEAIRITLSLDETQGGGR